MWIQLERKEERANFSTCAGLVLPDFAVFQNVGLLLVGLSRKCAWGRCTIFVLVFHDSHRHTFVHEERSKFTSALPPNFLIMFIYGEEPHMGVMVRSPHTCPGC